jgi:hypothetical protein
VRGNFRYEGDARGIMRGSYPGPVVFETARAVYTSRTMPKEYTYTDQSTNKRIFHCVEEDRVDPRDIDARVLAATGEDPRLNRAIACEIRQIGAAQRSSVGRFDRNKKLW